MCIRQRAAICSAKTVYEQIISRGLLGPPAVGVPSLLAGRSAASVGEQGYDERRDFSMQGVMVRLFVMMHQHESAVAKARALWNEPGALRHSAARKTAS